MVLTMVSSAIKPFLFTLAKTLSCKVLKFNTNQHMERKTETLYKLIEAAELHVQY